MMPYEESLLNPVVHQLRKPSDKMLQTNEDELIALIQWYGKRIHDGLLFRQRIRDDVERMAGLVNALEQLGWFDAS